MSSQPENESASLLEEIEGAVDVKLATANEEAIATQTELAAEPPPTAEPAAESTAEAPPATEEDAEEVLAAEFLETAEEAAADAAQVSTDAPAELDASAAAAAEGAIRPSRRLSKAQPVISERKLRAQRQARLIIRGGMVLLMLACIAAGSYRIPLLMGKGLIWPWNVIFPEKTQPREKISGRAYKTISGQVIEEKAAIKLANEVHNALEVAERLFNDAKSQYAEGNKIEAIVTVARAQAVLGPMANQVRELTDLPQIKDLVKPVNDMDFEINTKNTQWRRELDINDADRLQEALKAAELLPTEDGEQEEADGKGDDVADEEKEGEEEKTNAAKDQGDAEGGAEPQTPE